MSVTVLEKKISKLSEKISKYREKIVTLNKELKVLKKSLREKKKTSKNNISIREIINSYEIVKGDSSGMVGGAGDWSLFPKGISTNMTTFFSRKKAATTPKIEPKKENEVVVIVFGLGCDRFIPQEYTSIGRDINGEALIYSEILSRRCIILCEQGIKQVVGNIAKMATRVGGPTIMFVNRVYDEVLKLVNDDTITRIDIVGHSYGGSVVSKMLEKWNKQIEENTRSDVLDKCYVHTLGSIYIPSPSKTINLNLAGMKINHYMFRNDVAKKVRLPPISANVIWLGNMKSSATIFGTKQEWDIHRDFIYDFLIYTVKQKLEPQQVKEEIDKLINITQRRDSDDS